MQEFCRLPEISRKVPGKTEVMVIKDNTGTKGLAIASHDYDVATSNRF